MDTGVSPLTAAQTSEQEKQASKEGYVRRVLIGFDQFVNVVCGGHPDETISARSGRAAAEGKLWGKAMSRFLDVFQPDHGAKAEAGDLARAERVAYLEQNQGSSLDGK